MKNIPFPTCVLFAALALCGASAWTDTLRVCADNPRYFADDGGNAIFLTGSHTWATLHDRRMEETPPFDYAAWLDFMEEHGHNFLRLWAWEHTAWMQFTGRMIRYSPNRYARTGPGLALDGDPKFDLTQFNEAYFDRLRERVEAAGKKGIYVSVMLFQGFSLDKTQGGKRGNNAFRGHPMHAANNINGIDGDPGGGGTGHAVHTLAVPEITRLQEAYVRKTIDALNDLDNVLWEISNESMTNSVAWQYHMIGYIHEYEKTKPKQHPVGMTGSPIEDRELFASNADWISPKGKAWSNNPPAGDGRKVIISDTDHYAPSSGDPAMLWKSFFRGLNFIAMDFYRDARVGSPKIPDPEWADIRPQMGHALRLAQSIDLNAAVPNGALASTEYCLADPGRDYLVYLPKGGDATLDLTGAAGEFRVTWWATAEGKRTAGGTCQGGAKRVLTAPIPGPAIVRVRVPGD